MHCIYRVIYYVEERTSKTVLNPCTAETIYMVSSNFSFVYNATDMEKLVKTLKYFLFKSLRIKGFFPIESI